MNLMKSFINDPKNFDKMIKVILSAGKPELFDKDFLVNCGFSESNSILYSNLFISLGLIDEKGVPVAEYDRFLKSDEESRLVIAEKIWEKYTPIFAEDRHIQDKPIEKISEVFRKVYDTEHSESFIHLIALTFKALIDYAGLKTTKKIIEPQLVASETYKNGVSEHNEDDEFGLHSEPDIDETEDTLLRDSLPGSEDEEKTDSKINDHSETDPDMVYPDILDELFSDSELSENDNQEDSVETDTFYKDTKKMTDTETLVNRTVKNEKNGNEFLSKALFKRANLLQKLDRVEEEVEALNQIVEYFDKEGKNSVNEDILSKTLIRKAEILEQLGDDEKALAAYEDYIQRFYKTE